VSSLDLAAYLGARDPLFSMTKLAATQPVLERHTRWIQEFLASKGIKEKITASVEPALPGDYNIVFQPSRPLPAVAAVTFEHNQLLTQEQLREAIAPTGVGAPYTEDRFRQVLNAAIRPLYEKRGHMKVAFPEIRSETVKDVEGVHVFVTVDEGVSYELGKVTIEGATPISAAELIKVGEFKGGDVADSDKLNEGMERIRKAVWRAGYMNAKVTSDRRIDDVKKTINVALRIEAGTQYTMGRVTFTGLDLNSEAEMRRVWGLKEGKPFDPDYPDNFLKRIREQGFFDNLGQTKAETKINEKTHTADVVLTFKGAPPPAPGRRGGRGGGA
jgi:outer membrane protein assembly factor BamA